MWNRYWRCIMRHVGVSAPTTACGILGRALRLYTWASIAFVITASRLLRCYYCVVTIALFIVTLGLIAKASSGVNYEWNYGIAGIERYYGSRVTVLRTGVRYYGSRVTV